MSSATLAAHDALLPRPPGGNGAGAMLALVVHAGLVVALTTSIDWRSHPQEVVSAELWASVPQMAAPEPPPPPVPAPAPAPTPPTPAQRTEAPPREADIAIEQDKKRKAEEQRKKAEAELERTRERDRIEAENKKKERDKAEADKKKRDQEIREAAAAAAADEQRLAEQREANLRRMMGQAAQATGTGSSRSTGTAAQDAAPSAAYAGRVAALIRRNSVFTGSVPGNPAAEVEVTAAASGTIIARRLVKPSGHKPWDDAVLQAIDKVGTLPRDTDGRVPSSMIIAFRPKE